MPSHRTPRAAHARRLTSSMSGGAWTSKQGQAKHPLPAPLLLIPCASRSHPTPPLQALRPDLLRLRVLGRCLVMWHHIQPTTEWVKAQMAPIFRVGGCALELAWVCALRTCCPPTGYGMGHKCATHPPTACPCPHTPHQHSTPPLAPPTAHAGSPLVPPRPHGAPQQASPRHQHRCAGGRPAACALGLCAPLPARGCRRAVRARARAPGGAGGQLPCAGAALRGVRVGVGVRGGACVQSGGGERGGGGE